MIEIIIPAGASIIISVAGYLFNKNKVDRWFEQNRIDKRKSKDPLACGVCGSHMVIKKRHTGKHAGKEFLVCSRYPECRRVEWD